jgi:hypothetical protein
MLSVVMTNVGLFNCYAQCQYAEFHFAECRYAECRDAKRTL